MADNREESEIERLPTDLQTDIISRVASHSRRGVRNLLAANPRLATSAAVPQVYRSLNIHPLTVHPRATFIRYKSLMECCLASGNLQAHYIRGIHEYFEKNNINVGLQHIRIAAEGSYDTAIYLYGIIMLCTGQQPLGKELLDSLQWRVNKGRADSCWRKIKRSIHRITVVQLELYMSTYLNMRATVTCHPDGFRKRCDACFYYKQVSKFVFIA